MDRRIRLGGIGVGSRGQWLLQAAAMHPAVEITAICDPNEENLEKCHQLLQEKLNVDVKCFKTSEELLASPDVDAVIVATHIARHTEEAVKALEAGKHVLSEIPTIGNIEDAKALLRAVKAHPELKYMAAENCCYWAFIRKWKELYEDGEIGQVLFAESDYIHPFCTMERADGKPTWRNYMPAIHYITHNLGPILYILDDTVAEVSGFVPDINPLEERHPVPADGVAMIKTKKGTLIKIYIGFGNMHGGGHNFILYGSEGSLENGRIGSMEQRFTHAYLKSNERFKVEEIPVSTAFPGESAAGHGGADPKMAHDFIECILNDTKPPLDVEFGVNVSLPGLLADQSSKEGGRAIRMPSIEEIM